jgi:hypothetical protein
LVVRCRVCLWELQRAFKLPLLTCGGLNHAAAAWWFGAHKHLEEGLVKKGDLGFGERLNHKALVTLIKIHPQTKQKHKEVQNKTREPKKCPLVRRGGPENES